MQETIYKVEEMLYSYLNGRQNFSYVVSSEVCQFKDLGIVNEI